MKKIISFFIFLILCLIIYIEINIYKVNQKSVILFGKLTYINAEVNEYKEGKLMKTSSPNIGIITCIDPVSNEFFALGHNICLSEENTSGTFEGAKFLQAVKSKSNNVGFIQAYANKKIEYGEISNNKNYGIYGTFKENSLINFNDYSSISIASRYEIKLGSADIVMDLDGKGLKEYQCQIVGIDYFDEVFNLKIKVIDEELVELTGGIIKGMSGAPVVQNGKLIGAINYVLKEDSKYGYAVFSDRMF